MTQPDVSLEPIVEEYCGQFEWLPLVMRDRTLYCTCLNPKFAKEKASDAKAIVCTHANDAAVDFAWTRTG